MGTLLLAALAAGVGNAQDGKDAQVLRGHEAGVTRLAVSPDGLWLASASLDHTVRLWDPESGECLRTFTGHTDEVYAVAFSADGLLLASTGNDRQLLVQEVESGRVVTRVEDLPSWGLCVAVAPDGTRVAVGCADGGTRLFEIPGGAAAGEVPGRGTVEAAVFDPEGRWLALGGAGIRLVDAESLRPVRSLQGHRDKVSELSFSADGALLASASHDRTARLWDPDSGEPRGTLRCEVPVGAYVGQEGVGGGVTLSLPLTSVAFSPGGDRLAVGGAGRVVWLWDVATREQAGLLTGLPRSVTGVGFAVEGGVVFSACLDGLVRRHPLD